MYESVKQNIKFDVPQFRQERSVLFQIPIPGKSLRIFSTNKRHNAVSFTFFEKTSQNKRNF